MVAAFDRLFGNPLTRTWALRLLHARTLLERQPRHPDAWRWRITSRILGFLLVRYGDAVSAAWPVEHGASQPFGMLPPLDANAGCPPRSRAAMRGVLERIAVGNRTHPWWSRRVAG